MYHTYKYLVSDKFQDTYGNVINLLGLNNAYTYLEHIRVS